MRDKLRGIIYRNICLYVFDVCTNFVSFNDVGAFSTFCIYRFMVRQMIGRAHDNRTNEGRTNDGRTNDGRTNDSAPYVVMSYMTIISLRLSFFRTNDW